MTSATEVLRQYFGYDAFRTGQQTAVESVLAGKDTVVLLPTGAGKSLCYQVPAVARANQGTTLVVSPLIALMNDQVAALTGRGIAAACLHSQQSLHEQKQVIAEMMAGELALLYMSPERATSERFLRIVPRLSINLVAVDEAHCLSQWGHDFRPSYMQIDKLVRAVSAPTIALTATATPRVVNEIVRHLRLSKPTKVIGDFSRPNLRFSVHRLDTDAARQEKIIALLSEAGFGQTLGEGRAIIYCATRKRTEALAQVLSARGIATAYYHAGRSSEERDRVQRAFTARRCRVLVATNAFGMGIDYPDIRYSIHYAAPGSLAAYYQEAGRAGRDREPAHCVLFFGDRDTMTQRRIQSDSGRKNQTERALQDIRQYALGQSCRQVTLCSHFTGHDDHEACGTCDVCQNKVSEPEKVAKSPRVTPLPDEAKAMVLEAAYALARPVGKSNLAKCLRGSQAKSVQRLKLNRHPLFGRLKQFPEASVTHAIESLLDEEKLRCSGGKYPTIWPADKAVPGRRGPEKTRQNRQAHSAGSAPQATRVSAGSPAPPTRQRRFTDIRRGLDNYRRRKARELSWKPYMVFQKRAIIAIDESQPQTLADLGRIPGLGPAKIERFGEDILAIVRENA